MLVVYGYVRIIWIKPRIMGYVYNKILVWIPLDSNTYSRCISHETTVILSIFKLIFCNTNIAVIDSHTLYLDMFLWCSWSIPYEVRNITMQSILSNTGKPYGIYKSSFLWLDFSKRALVISSSVLFWLLLLPLSEDVSPSIVWTIQKILPVIHVVTINLIISRGRSLLLDVNPKGYEVEDHISIKVEVHPRMVSTSKITKSVLSMNTVVIFEKSMVVPLDILVALVKIQIRQVSYKLGIFFGRTFMSTFILISFSLKIDTWPKCWWTILEIFSSDKGTDSCDHNIPVYMSIDSENFYLKIVYIVFILVG